MMPGCMRPGGFILSYINYVILVLRLCVTQVEVDMMRYLLSIP